MMVVAEDLWLKINGKENFKPQTKERENTDSDTDQSEESWDSMEEDEDEDWQKEMENMNKAEELKAILNRLKEI